MNQKVHVCIIENLTNFPCCNISNRFRTFLFLMGLFLAIFFFNSYGFLHFFFWWVHRGRELVLVDCFLNEALELLECLVLILGEISEFGAFFLEGTRFGNLFIIRFGNLSSLKVLVIFLWIRWFLLPPLFCFIHWTSLNCRLVTAYDYVNFLTHGHSNYVVL